jgi:hypothetical protein
MKIHVPIYGEDKKKELLNFDTLRATQQIVPNLTVKVSPGSFWVYTSSGLTFVEFPGDDTDVVNVPIFHPKWYIVALSYVEGDEAVLIEGEEGADPDFPQIEFGRYPIAAIYLTPYTTAQERKTAISQSVKPNCLFLDFAGNIYRHGFLDQITGKDKKKKGDGIPPMKDCPVCFTILHASARKCSNCEHEFPMNTETKLEGLHSGAVMSLDAEREVLAVEYAVHNEFKEGKTPCLKVTYHHPDHTITKEYICLEHHGFALKKAQAWWKQHEGGYIEGSSVREIIDAGMCNHLLMPEKIIVTREGKYERISKYIRLHSPDLNAGSIDDITSDDAENMISLF